MAHSVFKTANATWHLIGETSPSLESSDQYEALLHAARLVRKNAYAPYSRFQVGAAVLMGGEIYSGCNVENASYGATICAERSAIFSGVANGARTIDALALTTDPSPGTPLDQRSPCGVCRQVISEFAKEHTPILIDAGDGAAYAGEIIALGQLLPWRFNL